MKETASKKLAGTTPRSNKESPRGENLGSARSAKEQSKLSPKNSAPAQLKSKEQ